MRNTRRPGLQTSHAIALVVALGLPLSALAQYKIVGPDGTVTYSDRAPVNAPGKVRQLDTSSATGTEVANAALPLELRQVVTRYPVTLYSQRGCEPCEAGRQLLRQRGIPHVEKLVGPSDGNALQAATGSQQIPALTIGAQVLRGFGADQWTSYLDAAGYPRASRLPPSYVAPAALPLVPEPVNPSSTVMTAPAPAAQTPTAPPPAPGGIRF